ncbi:glycosyltransferase [Flavobacterium sp. WW92]|uniref:glycosyltransferase n=1 Tax=unclassified Flavobacterium TaxID=196869 RepID=UPI00222546A7|nr:MULTISPECIES: glycosyltransferase [unclassified Flavobacterium]WDO14514.1 glycosyltransferase [Flavobacterium sp. WW92]
MKILQLIDSLEAGGAERMAVNYANSLGSRIEFSALAATRKEGPLKERLNENVSYLFLERKRTFDLKAVSKLKKFIKEQQIQIIHAHGTSFFLAVLLKLTYPKIKIVWHDHHGGRAAQSIYKNKMLKSCSRFFDAVVVVNMELKSWAMANLMVKNILYLPNFAVKEGNEEKRTILKGEDGKRIVCLSNLRNPKNHIALLEAFFKLGLKNKGWSLHFIGKEYNDDYSLQLKQFIKNNDVEEAVFIYGSAPDVYNILEQGSIGVLASLYEGFPVTLLEYGLSDLAVVSTNVGYCSEIIQDEKTGLVFDPTDRKKLEIQLDRLVRDKEFRTEMAAALSESIQLKYSEEIVMNALILQYQRIVDAE